ncbi:hypothetical protein INR49_022907 [Caranx melampygus]|nr:hypothetical protein INR49_022907 [Caranx melampygus]
MMQSGLSRELFESWCTDKRNGVIIAGYCVEGTLAKHIMTEPDEITTMSGQKLPLKMVGRLHLLLRSHRLPADQRVHPSAQTATCDPGPRGTERDARLKAALIREYEDNARFISKSTTHEH